MKAKILRKKTKTRLGALAMSFCILFTSFGGNGLVVFARTNEEESVSGNTLSEEQESLSEVSANSAPLIEDEDASGVYYNSSSNMTDFRDETIYFLMITRFYDGDSSNNVQCWDAKDKNANDPPWRGDFQGMIEKLDYIKALGFTAIWITPVVENASGYDYHGYHAIDFSEVDPRYESEGTTYQDLIDAAHEKGMKVIQDVVLNHTGNWGEENLYPIASKDYSKDLSDCVASMVLNYKYNWNMNGQYTSLDSIPQFNVREKLIMKAENDTKNIYHHNDYIKGWETYDEQVTSIAGDCMDLNTENPEVYHYLVDSYSKYIDMRVDAFRVDTVKHISRLTYNNAFISQLNDAYNKKHGTTGAGNFFMFGEVCTRVRDVWNRDIPALSCPFYTWKEDTYYAWNDSETQAAVATNTASVKQAYEDNKSLNNEPTSTNAFLNGNTYHTPDYSNASGMNVIDFPMHWNFASARDAFTVAVNGDKYYNDATFNVTYVDSHDYAPDGAPENQRFAGSQAQWAENLSLMFTFRGIPCIYYGSEVEFQKGKTIDAGTSKPLAETGRAYFGDYIEGSVDVADFARYTNATGKMAETLNHPLSLHIQRLNRLRAAIPALRKGQYTTDNCSGSGMAFKRRFSDSTTDSFVLVTISGDATFKNLPGGTYVDAITGDTKTISEGGSITTSGVTKQGDLRVYVLNTAKTPAPGMIEGYSNYMSGGKDVTVHVIEATGISLDKTSATLDLGDTMTFTATVSPSNATNKNVTWSSSNTSVATVANGTVTAKGEGTTTITAITSNGIKTTAAIKVEAKGVKVTSVTLSKSSVDLNAGETQQITATISPSNAEPKYAALTWTSSDTKVAAVSNQGLITAVKKGSATITATTASGVSATMTVTVNGTVIYGNAIYFEKPANWGSNINVYFWTGNGEWKNAGWPGVAMTETDDGVYGIQWPEGKENVTLNVIFNDGSNQTADLTAKINGYFNQSGYVKTIPVKVKPDDSVKIQAAFADSSVEYTYDGTEKKPKVVVKNNDTILTENTDYTLTYQNNVNAGEKTASSNAPTVIITGAGKYEATIPADTKLTFTINKAELPKNAPIDQSVVGNSKLYEVELGSGWAWLDESTPIKSGETVSVTAIYNGTDKNNYKILSVTVKITGIVCKHENKTEVQNAVTATCTTNGYTGDIFCKDCGALVTAGSTINKTGHSWNTGVVTKEATETTEGVRTYTCTKCQETKTEVIPKTTHVHKWDAGVVTIEPTATEEGEKTYTCSTCSETKTEVIPPTDEERISIEVSEEDVDEGETVKHKASATTYRITKNTEKKKEVEWVITKSKESTIKIPDSIWINKVEYKVTAIADSAFKSKKTIKTIIIGNNVKEIGKKAFYKCKNLKNITLGKNVKTMEAMAFYKCKSLTNITIPEKVNNIGKQAFYGCKNLSDITILTTKLTYKNVGSKAFKGISETATIIVPKKKLSKYEDILTDTGVSDEATIKKAK